MVLILVNGKDVSQTMRKQACRKFDEWL